MRASGGEYVPRTLNGVLLGWLGARTHTSTRTLPNAPPPRICAIFNVLTRVCYQRDHVWRCTLAPASQDYRQNARRRSPVTDVTIGQILRLNVRHKLTRNVRRLLRARPDERMPRLDGTAPKPAARRRAAPSSPAAKRRARSADANNPPSPARIGAQAALGHPTSPPTSAAPAAVVVVPVASRSAIGAQAALEPTASPPTSAAPAAGVVVPVAPRSAIADNPGPPASVGAQAALEHPASPPASAAQAADGVVPAAGASPSSRINFARVNPQQLRARASEHQGEREQAKHTLTLRLFAKYLAFVTINEGFGWLQGQENAVALLKALGFVGMALPSDGGARSYGFYAILEDAALTFSTEAGGMLDPQRAGTVRDIAAAHHVDADIIIGKQLPPTQSRPNPRPPKNFSAVRWSLLAAKVDVATVEPEAKPDLASYLGEYNAGRLLRHLQQFAVDAGAIEALDDLSFLEEMQVMGLAAPPRPATLQRVASHRVLMLAWTALGTQADFHDLVPPTHPTVAAYVAGRFDASTLFQAGDYV